MRRGARIFQEGEPNDRFSIVTQGEIEITRLVDDTTERVLQTLRPGDYFGEMSLLFADSMRSASGRARSEVQLLEMERNHFGTLLHRHPGLAVEILRKVVERLRLTENAVIAELRASNRELVTAYRELQAAQARLIEQERIEYELRTARQVQERMLPKALPPVEGWTLIHLLAPGTHRRRRLLRLLSCRRRPHRVYHRRCDGQGHPGVAGHGHDCSLVRFVGEQLQTPGAMLARINDRVAADIPEKMFVTCLVAVLEPSSGRMRFANAGHNLPFVRGAGGVRTLHARGMPLGLMAGDGIRRERRRHRSRRTADALQRRHRRGAQPAPRVVWRPPPFRLYRHPCRRSRTCRRPSATKSGGLRAKGSSRRTISPCL